MDITALENVPEDDENYGLVALIFLMDYGEKLNEARRVGENTLSAIAEHMGTVYISLKLQQGKRLLNMGQEHGYAYFQQLQLDLEHVIDTLKKLYATALEQQ